MCFVWSGGRDKVRPGEQGRGMSESLTLWQHLKRYFISGVLIVVPFILSFLVLRFLFETVDGILQPLLHNLLGYYRTGLGLLTTLLIILLAGVLTRNLLGAQLYQIGDRLAARVPLIRMIYSGSKQLLESMARPDAGSFQEVAMIEYPRPGLYSLCFVSNRNRMLLDGVEREYCTCFVPSTPTPVSGMTVIVPAEQVTTVNMTIEEGVKFCVSAGVVSPDLIKNRIQSAGVPLKGDGV
jgi:uncharacterized membrane protein